MKRIFACLLALVLLVSFTACTAPEQGGTATTTAASATTTTAEAVTTTTVETPVTGTETTVVTEGETTTTSVVTTAIPVVTTTVTATPSVTTVGTTATTLTPTVLVTTTTAKVTTTTKVTTMTTKATTTKAPTTTKKPTTTTTTTRITTTTTKFVDPVYNSGVYINTSSGSDSNAGTQNAPLKTLAGAINKVNALGLTGNQRVITYLISDWGSESFWLKGKCNAYTENITVCCDTPGRTAWSNGDMYLVGPLTLNCKYGNMGPKCGMEITTNGNAIKFGPLAEDVYGNTTIDGVVYEPADEIVKVTCVGDSITRNGYWSNGMQGLLPTDKYLVKGFGVDSSTAMSTGISGSGEKMAYTSKTAYTNSLATNPDIVVIMLGTNDAFSFNWDQACNANGAQFKADYKALIKSYQDLPTHPEVFMVLSPTSFYDGGNCRQNLQNKVIPALREIAAETGITLVDANTPTANAQAHFQDGLHPSDDAGRLLIATPIAAAIKQYVENQ